MDDSHLNECYNYVLDTIIKCGEIMKTGYLNLSIFESQEGCCEIAAQYSRQVEKLLIEEISKKYPNQKFVSKETTKIVPTLTDTPTWIIDPMDGLTNYEHRIKLASISVALVMNEELLFGYVYNPLQNQLYTARKGNGAFLNGDRLRSSKVKKIENSLISHDIWMAMATKQSMADKTLEKARIFATRSQGIRSFGCPSLSLCYVARGSIDAYQADCVELWDIAAGTLIVREAGGVVTTRGAEEDIMKPNVFAAGTPQLAQTVIEIVQEVDEKYF